MNCELHPPVSAALLMSRTGQVREVVPVTDLDPEMDPEMDQRWPEHPIRCLCFHRDAPTS